MIEIKIVMIIGDIKNQRNKNNSTMFTMIEIKIINRRILHIFFFDHENKNKQEKNTKTFKSFFWFEFILLGLLHTARAYSKSFLFFLSQT